MQTYRVNNCMQKTPEKKTLKITNKKIALIAVHGVRGLNVLLKFSRASPSPVIAVIKDRRLPNESKTNDEVR